MVAKNHKHLYLNRFRKLLLVALFDVLLAVTVIRDSNSMETSKDQEVEQATSHPTVVGPLYEFSGKLLAELNKKDGQQNIIMSPVSIHQAISMVLLGSDANSETKREILDAIGYSNMSQGQVDRCHEDYAKVMTNFERITKETLAKRKKFEETSNRSTIAVSPHWEIARNQPRSPVLDIFTMLVTKNKAQVQADYAKDIEKYYHASIRNIDDGKPETKSDLLKKMNDWAKEAGFEQPIMDEKYLDDPFEALLLSAVLVEAFWEENLIEFEGKKIFYNFGSKDKPVDGKCLTGRSLAGSRFLEFTSSERAKAEHMSQDEAFNQLSGLNFRAVQIPLLGDLSFAIFEPLGGDANDTSSPGTTIASLNKLALELFATSSDQDGPTTNLAKALELLDVADNGNQMSQFRMPKFKFESHIDLKSILKSIGLKRAFDQGQAEISNIMKDKLHISDIKHKAVIEATKTGIKAAGITMIKMTNSALQSGGIEVIIENPFIFVLRYQGIPLFVGQLTNL